MKKIVLFLIISLLFLGCEKGDNLYDGSGEEPISASAFLVDTTGLSDTLSLEAITLLGKKIDTVKVGEKLSFCGFISRVDPTLTTMWNFGDGTLSDKPFAEHAFATKGTFSALFSVSDPAGFSTSDTTVVHVEEIQGAPVNGVVSLAGKNSAAISIKIFKAGTEILVDSLPVNADGYYAIPNLDHNIKHTFVFFSAIPGYDTITVAEVQSNYGMLTTLDTILITDSNNPLISTVLPQGMKNTEREMIISGIISDIGSGVNLSTFSLTINNTLIADSLISYTPTASAVSFSYSPPRLSDGTYTALALISDSAANSDTISWTFGVDGMSITSLPDTTVLINDTINLYATVTNAYSLVSKYDFNFDGDSIIDTTIVSTANTVALKHAYTTEKEFTTIVSATDDQGTVKSDTIHIKVNNNAPVIDSLTPNTTISINDSIQFYLAASDKDGSITKYEWDLDGDGLYEVVSETPVLPTKKYGDTPTEIKVRVRLTDDDHKVTEDSLQVSVVLDKPTAGITSSGAIIVGSDIVLSGTGAQTFGSIVMYKWDNGIAPGWDDSGAVMNSFTTKYATKGIYFTKLYVRDDDGNEDSTTHRLTVANDNPLITTKLPDKTISIGDKVDFTIAATDNNDIEEYIWNFGDGSALKTTTVGTQSHTFPKTPQTCNVIVTIKDSFDGVSYDTAVVEIKEDKPYVFAGLDTNLTINDQLLLQATFEDTLGTVTAVEWSIDGDSFTAMQIDNADTTITLPATEDLNYLCILKVTDDDGFVVLDSMKVSVHSDPPTATLIAPQNAKLDSSFSVKATASHGKYGNGSIVKYEASIGSLDNFSITNFMGSQTITTGNDETDSFPIVFKVTDDDGLCAYDTSYVSLQRAWELIGKRGIFGSNVFRTKVINDIVFLFDKSVYELKAFNHTIKKDFPLENYAQNKYLVDVTHNGTSHCFARVSYNTDSLYIHSDYSAGSSGPINYSYPVSLSKVPYISICSDTLTGDIYVAYLTPKDATNNGIIVYKNDIQIGTEAVIDSVLPASAVESSYKPFFLTFVDGSLYLASSKVNNKLILKKHVGGTWIDIPSPGFNYLAGSDCKWNFITRGNNDHYFSFKTGVDELKHFKFNGTSWDEIGTQKIQATSSIAVAFNPKNNNPYFVASSETLGEPLVGYYDNTKNEFIDSIPSPSPLLGNQQATSELSASFNNSGLLVFFRDDSQLSDPLTIIKYR